MNGELKHRNNSKYFQDSWYEQFEKLYGHMLDDIYVHLEKARDELYNGIRFNIMSCWFSQGIDNDEIKITPEGLSILGQRVTLFTKFFKLKGFEVSVDHHYIKKLGEPLMETLIIRWMPGDRILFFEITHVKYNPLQLPV